MDVDLHDRKDARPVEARGKPRLLQREGVERSLAREVHPFEPVRRALAAEAAGWPRRRAAVAAAGGHEPPRRQTRVELVKLRVVRRLQREGVDRAEVGHAPTTGHFASRRASLEIVAVRYMSRSMSKWFEPFPLSPPSETETPASSISGNRPWATSPFVCLSAADGQ